MDIWLLPIAACATVALPKPQIDLPIINIIKEQMETVIFKLDKVDLKRINNPFNIRPSSSKWVGEIGVNSGFVVFDTMEHGARAGLINLAVGYFNKGINTIATIVAKYAPATENDDSKYIAFLTEKLKILKIHKIVPTQNAFRDLAYYICWYENGSNDVCTLDQFDLLLNKYGYTYADGKITFTNR